MQYQKITVKDVLLTLLLFPIGIIVAVCLVLFTPFDYLCYKRTRYYKDTHDKYTWLSGRSPYITLYNVIKTEEFPIEYYRVADSFTGYGYFVCGDTLILNDYNPCYDEETGHWQVEIEDEYVDIQTDVADEIKQCNELLKAEVCRKAVVLMDGDTWEEHPDVAYENLTFVPVYEEDLPKAIKEWII